MTWQHYHRASDMHGWLDYLAKTYPDACSVQVIGTSVEGRPLKVLHIKGKPGSPAMWVDGGEWSPIYTLSLSLPLAYNLLFSMLSVSCRYPRSRMDHVRLRIVHAE